MPAHPILHQRTHISKACEPRLPAPVTRAAVDSFSMIIAEPPARAGEGDITDDGTGGADVENRSKRRVQRKASEDILN